MRVSSPPPFFGASTSVRDVVVLGEELGAHGADRVAAVVGAPALAGEHAAVDAALAPLGAAAFAGQLMAKRVQVLGQAR